MMGEFVWNLYVPSRGDQASSKHPPRAAAGGEAGLMCWAARHDETNSSLSHIVTFVTDRFLVSKQIPMPARHTLITVKRRRFLFES